MNSRFTRKNHSIDSLAALLLFAMYVLFLLFLMLFGAGNYQASVKSLDTNNNLYTAASYITTKFRQHDIPGMTSLTELQGTQVLCFQEAIEGKDYCTYIYFDGSHLKELFTASDSRADLSMGTNLAQLQDFQIVVLDVEVFGSIPFLVFLGISSFAAIIVWYILLSLFTRKSK